MKMLRPGHDGFRAVLSEAADLRVRLAEANETLRAIRSGEVDAVVVTGLRGPQVFTLEGAADVYRVLIESMNEGALTLASDKMILYANRRFALMVGSPLEQVIGGSLGRFLSSEDRTALRPLLVRGTKSGAKIQSWLIAGEGAKLPVQISVWPLAGNRGDRAVMGLVVTDLTEARRAEEMLRALARRIVQVQEEERGRVALELHDNITQLVCGLLFRSQALANHLSGRDGNLKQEAMELRDMLGRTAEEVERISHNLGPHVLDHLGLIAALGEVGTEFEARTGVVVTLTSVRLADRLPPDTELALYRILQEALRNVEKHASARNVAVCLSRDRGFARFAISDDGVGFVSDRPAARKARGRLGLLGMSERAGYVGGTLKIKSGPEGGTRIEVLVPLGPAGPAGRRSKG
jgi:PAS domain S-box-containing protein